MAEITNTNLLASISLFENLNEEQYAAISEISKTSSYKKYSYVYKNGENADKLYFLLGGRIKICSYNEIGKELIRTIHYTGEMFGEGGLLNNNNREDYAISMDSSVKVLEIDIIAFRKFLCKYPDLSIAVSSNISNKLKSAQKRIENFIFKSARTRIIDFIKDLAQKQGMPIGYEVLIKNFLTHNEIASLIGTSRQTVTIVLSELKKSNQIHIDRKNVLIRNIESLE